MISLSLQTESYHQYLEPLSPAEATDAIEKPLQRMQVKVGYDSEFLANCLVPSLLQCSEGESDKQIEPVHLQAVHNCYLLIPFNSTFGFPVDVVTAADVSHNFFE